MAKTVSAPVGEVVFSQYQYWRKTGIRLNRATSARISDGAAEMQDGDFLVKSIIDGKDVYCTEKPSFRILAGENSACFVDRTGAGTFDQVKVASDVAWRIADLAAPLPYGAGELAIRRLDAYKTELVYQGFSKDDLRLAYHEYISDMARPVFFEDLTYKISRFPAEIRFTQVQIQVTNAGKSGIEYQLISNTSLP